MAEVTEDRLLDGRVRLRQPADGYRAAIDPVFLAAACPAGEGQAVLDVGCGVGAAALCLAVRVPGCAVTGLEIQPAIAGLARENAALNAVEDRVRIVTGDLLAPPPELAPGRFDHVLANPPFLEAGTFTPPPNASRATAHGEGEADLAAWIAFAARMLRRKGTLTLIHRADRVDAVLAGLHGRFGEVAIAPLWPREGEAARRILVRARKEVAAPARLAPGLVLHGPDGRFTSAADAILRDAGAFPF